MKLISAKLPHDDADAQLMRFDNICGQRYTEIFLIGGHPIIYDITAGIYNTIGLNDPDGTGDTTPQAVLDQVDLDALTKQYDVLSAFKNGPRLWTLVMGAAITTARMIAIRYTSKLLHSEQDSMAESAAAALADSPDSSAI